MYLVVIIIHYNNYYAEASAVSRSCSLCNGAYSICRKYFSRQPARPFCSQLVLHSSRHMYGLSGLSTARVGAVGELHCAAATGDACEQRGHALRGERGGGQVRCNNKPCCVICFVIASREWTDLGPYSHADWLDDQRADCATSWRRALQARAPRRPCLDTLCL